MIIHECRFDIHFMNQLGVCLGVLQDLGVVQELLGLVDGFNREIGIMFVNRHCIGQDLGISLRPVLGVKMTNPSYIL
jgi:hypothetical protein